MLKFRNSSEMCVFSVSDFHFPSVFMYNLSINQGGGQPSNVRPTAVRRGLHSSDHWDYRVRAPRLVLLSATSLAHSIWSWIAAPPFWGKDVRKSTDELWYSFFEFCVVSICSDMMNLSIGREDESKYDMWFNIGHEDESKYDVLESCPKKWIWNIPSFTLGISILYPMYVSFSLILIIRLGTVSHTASYLRILSQQNTFTQRGFRTVFHSNKFVEKLVGCFVWGIQVFLRCSRFEDGYGVGWMKWI